LKPAIDGAFLYDQCWLIYYDSKVEQENGYATELCLAMESEWLKDEDEIYKDFLKLIISRASFKLMVAQANSQSQADRIVQICQLGLDHFQGLDNSEYMLSLFAERGVRHFRKTGS